MARKTKIVTISGNPENRDNGRRYLLTELPADQGERWGIRLLLAIAHAGGKLPEGALDAGMAGVAMTLQSSIVVGFRSMAGLRFEDIEPLLDIMFSCVQYVPEAPNAPPQPLTNANAPEEVTTRALLRWEVLQLHLNFSVAEFLSNLATKPTPPPPLT